MTILTGRIASNSLNIGFQDHFPSYLISSCRGSTDLKLVLVPHRSAKYHQNPRNPFATMRHKKYLSRHNVSLKYMLLNAINKNVGHDYIQIFSVRLSTLTKDFCILEPLLLTVEKNGWNTQVTQCRKYASYVSIRIP